MKKSLALIGILLIAAQAFATETSGLAVLSQSGGLDVYFENGGLKPEVRERINAEAGNAPDVVLGLVDDRKLNIYITLDDTTVKSYWVNVQGKQISEAGEGARSDAAFEIRMHEGTLDAIVSSGEPFGVALESYNSGEIKYTALTDAGKGEEFVVGIGAKIAGAVHWVVNFLGGIFGQR